VQKFVSEKDLSENDLNTFQAWLKCQGIYAATTAPHELNIVTQHVR
jgi:hypothetical protein